MVRIRYNNFAVVSSLVAGDLCFGDGGFDLWCFGNGGRFDCSGAGYGGDLDICFGFNDFLWEAEGVGGGGGEEVDGGDEPDGGDGGD